MAKFSYSTVRFLFGIFIICLGLRNLNDQALHKHYINATIQNFKRDVNVAPISFFDFEIPFKDMLNFDLLEQSAGNLIYLEVFLLIFGGLLCCIGLSLSKIIILAAFFIDFVFVHNLYHFKDDKLKSGSFKIVSIFGAVFFII